jgi:hypothetical protein
MGGERLSIRRRRCGRANAVNGYREGWDVMFEAITDMSAGCDLCGDKPTDGQLYISEKYLRVCSACKQKLEAMPASTRDTLENYLIGNVL